MMIASGVAMGLIDNGKSGVALPVLCYFVTSLFFNGGLSRRQIILFVTCFVLFVSVLAPMVQFSRSLGAQDASLGERFALIEDGIGSVFQADQREFAEQQIYLTFSSGSTNYYNYFGGYRGQTLLGRYAVLQMVDPVVAAIDWQGPVGGWAIWGSLTRLIPRIFYPDKPSGAQAYDILLRSGWFNRAPVCFPRCPSSDKSMQHME